MCTFCEKDYDRMWIQTGGAYAMKDKFPVADGHTLIIPHRHVESFFHLTREEQEDMLWLMVRMREILRIRLDDIDGFTVGINDGAAAGQTVMHAHMHIIPRRVGDTENPRGGIRGVIPSKRDYREEETV